MIRASMDNSKAFHAPLHQNDAETQTEGCRQMNPDACAKNQMPKVCAFARIDGMCLSPPSTWPKRFRRLSLLAAG